MLLRGARIRPDGLDYATYNLVNPHTVDGVSLDTFIDWLTERGPLAARLEDYAEWVRRLEIGLRALPNHLRQRSLLPLIHASAEPEQLPELLVPADEFRSAVRRHHIGGGDIPSITRALVGKYVDDLQALGLLDSAEVLVNDARADNPRVSDARVRPADRAGREVVGATR